MTGFFNLRRLTVLPTVMADPFDSQHFKEDVFPELLKKLKVDEIRCALFSGGLINRSELKRLKNLTSDEEKVEMLFVEILPRHVNAQEALEKFVTILRNNPRQSPLADLFASLTPNSELPTNMPESSSTAEVSNSAYTCTGWALFCRLM